MASGRFLADGIAKREKEGRHRVPQKNRPPKLTRKRPHLGVGSLGNRERVGKLSRRLRCRASLAKSGCLCALAPRGAPRLPAPLSAPGSIAFPFSRRCRAGWPSRVRRVGCSLVGRNLDAAVTLLDE